MHMYKDTCMCVLGHKCACANKYVYLCVCVCVWRGMPEHMQTCLYKCVCANVLTVVHRCVGFVCVYTCGHVNTSQGKGKIVTIQIMRHIWGVEYSSTA